MPSSNSSRLIPSVSPFSFPSFSTSSGMSFESSSVGSSLSVNSSSVSVPTVITSSPLSGSQLSSTTNTFTGSSFASGFPAYSSTTFGVVSSSTVCSSLAFGFPASSSSSTSGSLLFGPSLISTSSSFSAPTLSTASTALPIQPSAPPSFPSFVPPSSSSLFSASSAQPFSFGTSSTYSKSNTSSASSAASVPAAISASLSSSSSTSSNFSLRTPSSPAFESSFGFKSPASSNDSASFFITPSSSSSFQSSFGYKSAPSAEAGTVSTAMTSSGTTMMPASLCFATSSAPSFSYTVTIPGASLPAGSTIPSFGRFLFSSQAAGSAADTPSVPVTGVTTSFAANTSTLASKSTPISSASNSPYPFPSFSLPTEISAPTSSSEPQSTTSAAISVLAIKDSMERMQLEKSALVEVGVQSDLPAHKVNQVASSEIVRSGPSEAEPCMESMQAENPDSEVEVQSAVPAATVNQVAGSEIVRAGPEGVPPLDKVVGQLETSARLVNVLAENCSTEDQPMDQSMVQSTPVDTVREFEAATSFQESELNRIFSNLFVCVEGFLVPRPYVELYKKILRRYGHMATTEVLTDCPLGLMGVATEVMRLFEEMASCTKTDLSEDLLRRWDFRLSSAESLKFKVDWLRQRLEEVKSSYRHQIENADAIEAVRSSLAVTESKLTAVIARRENHLKAKQAAEAIHKAAEAALAMVNSTLQQDDEEISVFESEKLDQLVKLCAVEGDFMPGVTLASDLL